jgi:hypothetical protein
MGKYSCFLISNKPYYYPIISKSISPIDLKFFDGTGYPSFSKLVNECVHSADSEIVILMSDKVKPKEADVNKVLDLLDQGYGFVGLYRLAFFGFKKELFRKIGPFDERFVGGGYEDDDFYIRLKESDISMYVTEEIEYERRESSWQFTEACKHFLNKWLDQNDPNFDNVKLQNNVVSRKLVEENYNYNFGKSTGEKFLDWGYTVCPATKGRKYTGAPKKPKEIK